MLVVSLLVQPPRMRFNCSSSWYQELPYEFARGGLDLSAGHTPPTNSQTAARLGNIINAYHTSFFIFHCWAEIKPVHPFFPDTSCDQRMFCTRLLTDYPYGMYLIFSLPIRWGPWAEWYLNSMATFFVHRSCLRVDFPRPIRRVFSFSRGKRGVLLLM